MPPPAARPAEAPLFARLRALPGIPRLQKLQPEADARPQLADAPRRITMVQMGLDADAPRLDFFGLDAAAFDAAVIEWGWPRFRAQQVRDWVYGKGVTDPAQMSNLSKSDRQ